jgi:hypothetical protein
MSLRTAVPEDARSALGCPSIDGLDAASACSRGHVLLPRRRRAAALQDAFGIAHPRALYSQRPILASVSPNTLGSGFDRHPAIRYTGFLRGWVKTRAFAAYCILPTAFS